MTTPSTDGGRRDRSRAVASGTRIAVAALLAVAAAWLLARAIPRELDVAGARELSPRLSAALANADGEITFTWFGARADDLPSAWRSLPGEVHALLDLVARTGTPSHGVRTLELDPAHDAEAARLATRFGAVPIPARTVLADGWREEPVWSALRIADGARGSVLVPAVTPELVPRLQELVAAHLEALARPHRARIAVEAPERYLRLRTELGRAADALDADFEATARIADDVDLLVWIEPRSASAAHVGALRRHLERGGCAWIAGTRREARVEEHGGRAALVATHDGGSDALSALLAELGVQTPQGVVVERRGAAQTARGAQTDELALRVAAIGEMQDFRSLGSEPNGTLYFRSPTALEPDAERLAELGVAWRPLACSSPASWLVDVDDGPVDVRAMLATEDHMRSGSRALLAELESLDPWRGSVVVCGSASPFLDEELARDTDGENPHRALVHVLASELASPARVVRHAVARESPPELPALPARTRALARGAVVLLPALLATLIAILAARAPRSRSGGALRIANARTLAVGAALAIAVLALPWLVPRSAAVDMTRECLHAMPDELRRLADDATRGNEALTITTIFSPAEDLPAELRPVARRARERAREVAALSPEWTWIDRSPAAGEELARELNGSGGLGVQRLRVTSTLDEVRVVRSVYASIVVAQAAGSSSTGARGVTKAARLDFASPRDLEALDQRLAVALWTALGHERPVVAFAAGEERLSPAEALLEYERAGRFAPRGTARFQLARAALVRAGFDVRDVDPERPKMPEHCAALVWLLPRRDARPLGVELATLLAHGGKAFVALQPWRLRPIRRAGREGALGLWPEAQFPDLDRQWLPRFGIEPVPEIVSDTRSGSAVLDVKIERPSELDPSSEHRRTPGRAELARESITAPVILRAAPTDAARDELAARALPELVLPLAARFELDPVALARHGLRAQTLYATSDHAWTSAWTGGDLAAEALEPPTASSSSHPIARAPLALSVRGTFPGPEVEPAWSEATKATRNTSAATTNSPTANVEGALVLCGSSGAFADPALADSSAAERFLVQSVAALCLPRALAELGARSPAPQGLEPLSATHRAAWRATLLAGVPLLLALAGLSVAARRRRAPLAPELRR